MTRVTRYGLLAFVALLVAANAGHWFITPARHPHASNLRYLAAALQLLAGLLVTVWTWRKDRLLRGKQTS